MQSHIAALFIVVVALSSGPAPVTANAQEDQRVNKPALVKIQRSANAMGTTYTIDAYGNNAGALESATEEAFDEVRRLDEMLSNYLPDSELSRVNQGAFEAPVRVSKEFFQLLQDCLDYSRKSQGAFDITVGPLMKVWGFYKGSGHLPHQAEIREAMGHIGYEYVKLDPSTLTVRFSKAGMSLDPGGVGKGYAVDRMAAVLQRDGVASALISGGGSSIYGIGTPPADGRGWHISIRDPRNESKTAADLYLKDNSVSTSGSYEKFFWAEGKLYSHIMNPRTGYPSEGMLSVSVLSPRTLDSEVWAKPYYIWGRVWARQHKPKEFQILLCEDKPGVACEWLQ